MRFCQSMCRSHKQGFRRLTSLDFVWQHASSCNDHFLFDTVEA